MISFILFLSLLVLINGQTSSICPSGFNSNTQTSAFPNRLSPVTVLAGVTYNNGGLFAAKSAEECCYNCATQTGGICTAWTYNSCGTCYLSSATGSLTLNNAAPVYLGSQFCYFTSGLVRASANSPTLATTTTTRATTTTTTLATSGRCFSAEGTNVASSNDIFTTAESDNDCCNKCLNYPGCLGFAFYRVSPTYAGCWFKSYYPFGSQTPSTPVSYPGMILGTVISTGK